MSVFAVANELNMKKICTIQNIIGENPIWNSDLEMLFWIDLESPKLFTFDRKTKKCNSIDIASPLRCLCLYDKNQLVGISQNSLVVVDPADGKFSKLLDLPLSENLIFNEGKCDPFGRLWIGSSDIQFRDPIGFLFCLEGNNLVQKERNIIASNGIGWSNDCGRFYFTDTLKRLIYCYDFDVKTASLSNRRIFAKIPEAYGYPDGLTVDMEDYVWSAHWGGARITRYKPNGLVDLSLSLLVKNVTSLCFGDVDLSTLFITTSNFDFKNSSHLNSDAGCLFAEKTQAKGKLEYKFKKKD